MAQTLYTFNERLGSLPTISYDVDNQNWRTFSENAIILIDVKH